MRRISLHHESYSLQRCDDTSQDAWHDIYLTMEQEERNEREARDMAAASRRAEKLVMARRVLLLNIKAALRSYVAGSTDGGIVEAAANQASPAQRYLVECLETALRHGLRRPVGGYFVLVAEVAGAHRSMQRSVEKALAASAAAGPEVSPGTLWLGQALEKRRLAGYLDILVQETALLDQYYTEQGILVNEEDAATLRQSLNALQRTSRHQQRLSASVMEEDRLAGGSASPAGSRGSPAFSKSSASDLDRSNNDVFGTLSSPELPESPELEPTDIHSRSLELVLPALTQSYMTSSELERENAHFDVVEALIQALEESRNVDLVPRRKRISSSSAATLIFQQQRGQRGGASLQTSGRRYGHVRSRSDPIKWPPLHEEGSSASVSIIDGNVVVAAGGESTPPRRRASAAGTIGRPVFVSESPLRVQQLPGEYPPPIVEGAGSATLGQGEAVPGVAGIAGGDSGATSPRRSESMVDSDDSEVDLRVLVAEHGRLQNEIAKQFPSGLGVNYPAGGGGGARTTSSPSQGGEVRDGVGSSRARSRSSRAVSVTSASSDAMSEFWRSAGSETLVRRLPSVDTNHFTNLSDARSTAQGFLKSVMPSSAVVAGSHSRVGEWLPDVRPVIADEVVFPGGKLPEPIINVSALRDGVASKQIQDNLPINPEAEAGFVGSTATMLRGNDDWAPPRRQIIYHLHPNKLSKSKALEKQGYQCAGCGLIVELLSYVKRFRYCTYLGKYFCHSCHNNTACVIPAKVLWKWDFKKYPVSNFAREILIGEDSIRRDAVFDLRAVDQGSLYTKVAPLRKACEFREQLSQYRAYLKVCKDGETVLGMIDSPLHLASEPHLYSLEELESVKIGMYVPRLESLISTCAEHVKECDRCSAKGHICEICNSKEVIFPMQINVTTQCPQCRTVCHHKCWANKKTDCPKCVRIERYRLAKANRTASAN